MTTAMRVRSIGRALVCISLVLLALPLLKYLVNGVTHLAGYAGRVLLAAGFAVWFIGAVMVGYKAHPDTPKP